MATINVNGIRAAQRRGFSAWLDACDPGIVALQEVRCPREELPVHAFGALHCAYDAGNRAGRNGVAILTREPPAAVRTFPHLRGHRDFAAEGRYLEVDLADLPLTVVSVYVPKGGLPADLQRPGRMRETPDGGAAYARKLRFLAWLGRHTIAARRRARAAGREFVLMGDLNVAHLPLDVAMWRRSRDAVGFLPAERDWMDAQLSPRTLVDVVRRLHPDEPGPYSWWSWLGNSFERDSGWRIDHQLATPRLARTAVAAHVHRDIDGVRLSDHAPVVVDYAWAGKD